MTIEKLTWVPEVDTSGTNKTYSNTQSPPPGGHWRDNGNRRERRKAEALRRRKSRVR